MLLDVRLTEYVETKIIHLSGCPDLCIQYIHGRRCKFENIRAVFVIILFEHSPKFAVFDETL